MRLVERLPHEPRALEIEEFDAAIRTYEQNDMAAAIEQELQPRRSSMASVAPNPADLISGVSDPFIPYTYAQNRDDFRRALVAAIPVPHDREEWRKGLLALAFLVVVHDWPEVKTKAILDEWSAFAINADKSNNEQEWEDALRRTRARVSTGDTNIATHLSILKFARVAGWIPVTVSAAIPCEGAKQPPGQTSAQSVQLSSDSGWPDPKPVEAPLPPVAPFNLSYLPSAFSPYVKDQTDLMQCPPEYIAIPLMVAAAAALRNKIAIAPKAHDDGWLVAPVLWGAVVGRPGTMKSPAQEVAMLPLKSIEADLAKAYEAKRQQFRLDKVLYEAAIAMTKRAAAKGQPVSALPVEPEEPQPERLHLNDSTVQKLGEILRWSSRGVLVTRDELVSLLEQLGAERQEGARGFYLTAWNGLSSYRVDRIGRGSFVIQRLAICVYGGMQPGKLQPHVRHAVSGGNGDDGLLQRFQLLSWPDTPNAWRNVDRRPDLQAMQRVDDVFMMLRQVDPVAIGCEIDDLGNRPPWLHFTSEAQEVFDGWRQKLEDILRTGDKHPALESHLAKYRSLIPALALVIHLADGHTGPVGALPLKKAIAWGYYLHSHAKRVYASAIDAAGFSAKALADKIRAGKLGSAFNAREVQRHGWGFLSTPEDVRNAIDWLLDAGWIHGTTAAPGAKGGRPTEVFVINPKAAHG